MAVKCYRKLNVPKKIASYLRQVRRELCLIKLYWSDIPITIRIPILMRNHFRILIDALTTKRDCCCGTQKIFVERFAPRTRIIDRYCWPVKTNMTYKNLHLLASDGAATYRIIYMVYMCTIFHNYVSTTDV